MTESNILLIEDDVELSEVVSEILSYEGLQCEVIHDGQNALDWLQANIPYAILLDIHLPHVSGFEILDYIRGDQRLEQVPVIVMTADIKAAADIKAQADLVFTKPMGLEQFHKITEFLSR